jgi:predicted O-methyltransferase YrrM
MVLLAVLAVVQLRRRTSQEVRAVVRQTEGALTRAEASIRRTELAQRRILAAIESERLAAAERQQALATSLREIRAADDVAEQAHRRALAGAEEERVASGERHAALLAAIESERVAGDGRQDALVESLERTQEAIFAEQQRLHRNTASVQRDQTREVEALLQLFRDFAPRAPMPSSGGGWALNPTGLSELLFHIDRHRPKVVVELGSGASSVWIAYALEKIGGRLVTLDHEAKYADQTRSMISLHELDKVAEVRLAPLRPIDIDGESFDWYDAETLVGVDGIDLLLVDGPPGTVGPAARFPALPVLEHRLASNATVILDDVDRSDEQAIVDRWTAGIPGLRQEHQIFGRQAVLTYSRSL